MINLIGEQVEVEAYGKGTIVKQFNEHILIKFDYGLEKLFNIEEINKIQ